MSATDFETVQRQALRPGGRIERSLARNVSVRHLDGHDPANAARAGARLAPGLGLGLGALASLALWMAIGKAVLSLIG